MKQWEDVEITSIPQLMQHLKSYRDMFKEMALVSEYVRGRYNQNETIIALLNNTEPELMEMK